MNWLLPDCRGVFFSPQNVGVILNQLQRISSINRSKYANLCLLQLCHVENGHFAFWVSFQVWCWLQKSRLVQTCECTLFCIIFTYHLTPQISADQFWLNTKFSFHNLLHEEKKNNNNSACEVQACQRAKQPLYLWCFQLEALGCLLLLLDGIRQTLSSACSVATSKYAMVLFSSFFPSCKQFYMNSPFWIQFFLPFICES